jgi:hypothetical protein
MDPAEVAAGALDHLGKGPNWVPGAANQAIAKSVWPVPRVGLVNALSRAGAELLRPSVMRRSRGSSFTSPEHGAGAAHGGRARSGSDPRGARRASRASERHLGTRSIGARSMARAPSLDAPHVEPAVHDDVVLDPQVVVHDRRIANTDARVARSEPRRMHVGREEVASRTNTKWSAP